MTSTTPTTATTTASTANLTISGTIPALHSDISQLPTTFPSVNRVAVRLPPFWPEDPEMWFVQIEQQFALSDITSEHTKFSYVVGNLEPKYASEVRDVLTNPPTQNRYTKLKTELIKRLSETQENKVRRLLEHEEIGDRKPSQFLRHLRSLAGTVVPDDVLRPLWLSRLPSEIQAIVATRTQSPLDEMAELADVVAETLAPRGRIAEVQAHNNTETLESLMQRMILTMTSHIEEVKNSLKQEIAAVAHSSRNNRGFRGKSRDRSRSSGRSQNRSDGICWYHRKFSASAQKCTKPCSYSENSLAGR